MVDDGWGYERGQVCTSPADLLVELHGNTHGLASTERLLADHQSDAAAVNQAENAKRPPTTLKTHPDGKKQALWGI